MLSVLPAHTALPPKYPSAGSHLFSCFGTREAGGAGGLAASCGVGCDESLDLAISTTTPTISPLSMCPLVCAHLAPTVCCRPAQAERLAKAAVAAGGRQARPSDGQALYPLISQSESTLGPADDRYFFKSSRLASF